MKEKQTNSGMIELCQLGLRSHLQMVHWNAFRYLNPYLDWLFCTEVFTQRFQNPPFVKGTIWQTWLSFPVSQHSSLLSLFTAISSIRFHLLRFHTELLYVEWAPHLILIFDLSSPHPPPPLPLLPSSLSSSPCLCIPLCAFSSHLALSTPAWHLFLPVMFPGSRQQRVSLLHRGVAASQGERPTSPSVSASSINRPAQLAWQTDATHSASIHINTSREAAIPQAQREIIQGNKETFNLSDVTNTNQSLSGNVWLVIITMHSKVTVIIHYSQQASHLLSKSTNSRGGSRLVSLDDHTPKPKI